MLKANRPPAIGYLKKLNGIGAWRVRKIKLRKLVLTNENMA